MAVKRDPMVTKCLTVRGLKEELEHRGSGVVNWVLKLEGAPNSWERPLVYTLRGRLLVCLRPEMVTSMMRHRRSLQNLSHVVIPDDSMPGLEGRPLIPAVAGVWQTSWFELAKQLNSMAIARDGEIELYDPVLQELVPITASVTDTALVFNLPLRVAGRIGTVWFEHWLDQGRSETAW